MKQYWIKKQCFKENKVVLSAVNNLCSVVLLYIVVQNCSVLVLNKDCMVTQTSKSISKPKFELQPYLALKHDIFSVAAVL